jgi:molybdopterin synthase sulfur carrier subunit
MPSSSNVRRPEFLGQKPETRNQKKQKRDLSPISYPIPMPSVRIPTPLRKLTNEIEVVQTAGSNIGEVLEHLDKAFPGLKERICDDAGNVRRFVNIFVNDEDIRFLEDKSTVVKETDEISIVPAIAGG